MRALIILNPAADHGRALKLKEQLLVWGNRYADLDLWLTERRGHERELAERAVKAGYELIIAAGGDGTVHHVVNGLVHGGQPRATLGIIPIGSGNDFAYGLNLLVKPKRAVETIFTGERRLVDLARLEDDRGLYKMVTNSIGIGFDATVTIESQNITRVHGFAMYTLAALRTIALYYQTPRLQVHFDDELVNQQALLLAIGLGPRAGGGFFLTPDARHDDHLLDSCLVNPVGRLTMLWMLPKVMRGTHITSRHVSMRRSEYLDVRSDGDLPIHVDGEIFAYHEDHVRRVTVASVPQALAVMTPAV